METRIIDKWTVRTAQIENTVRKSSLSGVLDAYLKKIAAEVGIEKYRELLTRIQSDPNNYDTITEAERNFYDTAAALGAWIPISACCSPYIPIGEWLKLDEAVLNDLSTAAMELNPHWFAMPVTPAQEKKTKRRRKK